MRCKRFITQSLVLMPCNAFEKGELRGVAVECSIKFRIVYARSSTCSMQHKAKVYVVQFALRNNVQIKQMQCSYHMLNGI